MYNITIDSEAKLIYIELSGFMDQKEVEASATEVISILSQLKDKEYSMYADLGRLDPIPQDSIPIVTEAFKKSLLQLKKIATVHNRTVTRMQMRRIETSAKEGNNIENQILRFRTREEALSYLLNDKGIISCNLREKERGAITAPH